MFDFPATLVEQREKFSRAIGIPPCPALILKLGEQSRGSGRFSPEMRKNDPGVEAAAPLPSVTAYND